MSSDKESAGSNEVSEVMSPQVSLETMDPSTVTDLPRYHSLVEDFGRLADCWMAAGQLRGPANVGGGYLLDCQGHSSLNAPSELNPPQRIPSPLCCTTSATGRGLTVVLTCYSGRLSDVHVGRVDT